MDNANDRKDYNQLQKKLIELESKIKQLEESQVFCQYVEDELRQRNMYLNTLHEIALSMMNRLSLKDLFKDIVQRACQLLGTKHGFVCLVNPHSNLMEVKVGVGMYANYIGIKRRKGEAFSGIVWETGQPLAVENYQVWKEQFDNKESNYAWDEIKSVLGVPLTTENIVVGVIGLGFKKMREFNIDEINMLGRFAALASIALDNAVLYTALQEELAEREKVQKALIESDCRLREITDNMLDMVIKTSVDRVIEYASPSIKNILGYEPGEVLGRSILDFIHLGDIPRIPFKIQPNNDKSSVIKNVVRVKHAGDYYLWLECMGKRLYSSEEKLTGVIYGCRDVTERRKYEEKLRQLSLYDSLTGIFNRTYFEQQMQKLPAGNHSSIGIIICDVDGLKLVNDTLGHDAGDELIIAAAEVLKQCTGQETVLARIGGDEFAVLLTNTDKNSLDNLCLRIQSCVEEYNSLNPRSTLSISVGSAVHKIPVNMRELFKEADNCMYREKLKRKQSFRSSLVKRLMNNTESRDIMSGNYVDSLEDLAVRMGRALKLPQKRIADLCIFVRFHNIGMLGISDTAVFQEEGLKKHDIIKQHCEIGYNFAQAVPELVHIADWILKHHEWWNGKGYPLGLKGEEIPLECRILSVVDTYSAVINRAKPCQRGINHKLALNKIKESAGTQLDPELVDVFINLFTG